MASDDRTIKPPGLPEDSEVSYLNEGAANIVYKVAALHPSRTPPPSVLDSYGGGTPPPTEIEFTDQTPESAVFNNRLLRLRKDLPTTAPCLKAQESWGRLLQPLFAPNELIDQVLVRLPDGLINRLNKELQDLGDLRPTKRHDIYLADDEFGLLVTDMTPRYIGEEVIEFKPKWLVQSPAAPQNSIRCRTCALTARINAERMGTGEPLRKNFCPLDLISSDPHNISHVAEILLRPESIPSNIAPSTLLRFVRWLKDTTILQRLRDMQYTMDRKGVLEASVEDENFLVAMTLRDCTVFVRFPEDPERDEWEIEARIGDLDLKSKGKEEYWKSVERPLIEDGWYEGTEKDSQPLVCSLSRGRKIV